jgi:hypothetical protein
MISGLRNNRFNKTNGKITNKPVVWYILVLSIYRIRVFRVNKIIIRFWRKLFTTNIGK